MVSQASGTKFVALFFFFNIEGPNCSLNGVPEAAEADPSDPELGQLRGETANEP